MDYIETMKRTFLKRFVPYDDIDELDLPSCTQVEIVNEELIEEEPARLKTTFRLECIGNTAYAIVFFPARISGLYADSYYEGVNYILGQGELADHWMGNYYAFCFDSDHPSEIII